MMIDDMTARDHDYIERYVETLIDPASVETFDGPMKPLPLSDVLTNLETLHARCNGEHVCGLPRRLQRFDLADYLALSRAYRETQ